MALTERLGLDRPRLKWIPPFGIGREARRGREYEQWELLTAEDVAHPEAQQRLQCGTSRTVTSNGVWPCPILINEPAYRLADDIPAGTKAHRVDHPACHTCFVEGFTCST